MNTYVNICLNMALNGSSSSYCNSVNRIALIYHVDKHKLNGCKLIKSSGDEVVNLMTGGILLICATSGTQVRVVSVGVRLTSYCYICVHNSVIACLCIYVNTFVIKLVCLFVPISI